MKFVDWMHPSYRDLIIDELVVDQNLRLKFLSSANINDIKLAFSDSGGADGKRENPLISDIKSKELIKNRVFELAKTISDFEVWNLLHTIQYSEKRENENSSWINELLKAVLLLLKERWYGIPVWISALEIYCKVSVKFHPLIPLPDFEPSWNKAIFDIKNNLDSYLDSYYLSQWIDLIDLLQKNEPRLLKQIEFPKKYFDLVNEIIQTLELNINYEILNPNREDIIHEIESITDLITCLENLSIYFPFQKDKLSILIQGYGEKKQELNDSIDEEQELEKEDYDDQYRTQVFDIEFLFCDL